MMITKIKSYYILKILCVLILLSLACTQLFGCNNVSRQFYKLGIQYAGEDVNGNVASDIVENYYEELNIGANVDKYFTDYAVDFIKPTNGWGYGIKSATLTHCEVIDESNWFKSELFESDIMYLQDKKKEFYAWCIVQTADEVVRDDGSVEKRIFAYYLVMESANSEWKIQDYGYPPYYIPE